MLFISVHLTKMSIKFALLIVLSIASIQSSMHVDHGLTSLHFEGLPDKIFAGEQGFDFDAVFKCFSQLHL